MNKKGILAALIAIAMLGAVWAVDSSVGTVSAQKDIQVWVHGKSLKLTTAPVLEHNSALVPLRPVAEALGAKVQSKTDKNNKMTITLTRGDKTAVLTIGSKQMTANGRPVTLSAAPRLKGSVTLVPLRALSESLGTVVRWDSINRIAHVNNPDELPVIGSLDNLRNIAQNIYGSHGVHERASMKGLSGVTSSEMEATAAAPQAASADSAAGASGGGYSKTNVQVDGVDEADWAKTDGKFLYQLSSGRVMIVSIADPSSPKLAATIEYKNADGFYPQEMYVDEGRLVVIGQHSIPIQVKPVDPGIGGGVAPEPQPQTDAKMDATMPYYPTRQTVKTLVYELDAGGQPKLTRETELEGGYVSSRKIGGALYIVTNKYNDFYPLMENAKGNAKKNSSSEAFEPVYGDSGKSGKLTLKNLPLSRVRYFPESPETGTMIVGALDLDQPSQEMQVSAYLGSGQTIYASTKNLYAAITKYVPKGETYREETHVHKFRLDQGKVVYLGEGSVAGRILNQFSMDEHEGYFRIATTIGDPWGKASSTNHLYVLDESMKTIGTLGDLAPGERIYSTRFMGKRAYMVTFRNVDPLFAIDLTDPAKPAVLGQLKIPGYSDYLHPYGENHLIGFGKETIELSSQGMGKDATMAYYQGMKMALFDVTDPTNPKELFKEIIGDRGTQSELLHNHKALLFSKEKGLMAFPVDLMEIPDKKAIDPNGSPAYGQFTYQGAYVYGIDLSKGFTLRGRITHLTADDLAKSGTHGYDYNKAVRRILYSGDTLYTLSERMVKGNHLDSLAERGTLTYPAPPETVYPGGVKPGAPSIMPVPAR